MFNIGDIILHNGINYQISKVDGYNKIELHLLENAIVCDKEILKLLRNKSIDNVNYAIAKWFVETKILTHGYIASVRNTKIETNQNIIRRLHEIDGYNYIEIILTLSACMRDEFWKDIVLTCASLRKKIKGSKTQTWFDRIRMGLHLDNKKEDDIAMRQSVMDILE